MYLEPIKFATSRTTGFCHTVACFILVCFGQADRSGMIRLAVRISGLPIAETGTQVGHLFCGGYSWISSHHVSWYILLIAGYEPLPYRCIHACLDTYVCMCTHLCVCKHITHVYQYISYHIIGNQCFFFHTLWYTIHIYIYSCMRTKLYLWHILYCLLILITYTCHQ